MSKSQMGSGFELALAEMKKGAHIARLKWVTRTRRGSKIKIGLSPSNCIRSWYLNYHSDGGTLSTDDILANDWIIVELSPAKEPADE